jgi:hypothetical protein
VHKLEAWVVVEDNGRRNEIVFQKRSGILDHIRKKDYQKTFGKMGFSKVQCNGV